MLDNISNDIRQATEKLFSEIEFCDICRYPKKSCMCEKIKEEELNTKIDSEKNNILRLGGLRAYKEFTIQNFNRNGEIDKKILDCVKCYPETNLYIFGDVGTGKTHLGTALVREYPDGFVVKPQEILRKIRESQDSFEEKKNIQRYIEAKHILIDDFGTEKTTDFSMDKMYEIIDGRWMNYCSGMIITSNIPLNELPSLRIISRIKSMSKVIKLSGNDKRIGGIV